MPNIHTTTTTHAAAVSESNIYVYSMCDGIICDIAMALVLW